METNETKAELAASPDQAPELPRWVRYAAKRRASYAEAEGINAAQLHAASLAHPDRELKKRIKRRSAVCFDAIVWISRDRQSSPAQGGEAGKVQESSQAEPRKKTRRKRSRKRTEPKAQS